MVLKGIIFLALVALAAARKSPNADYVKEFLKSQPQLRASNNIEEDSQLDVPGLIRKYGYPEETHTVTTSDGYILELHRIPTGRDNHNKPGPRPVVFLMHGLLSSSADYLVLGPGSALGYYLAEAGYDVWLGNARGNYYSRKHKSLNPDSILNKNFWRFSWDEIGNYDLPAFIDYILSVTGQKKLHYVGHSQGGTSFLVLNSLRPEYSDKFISFQGLAPASFFDNNEVSLFNGLAPFETVIENAAFATGNAEIFGSRSFIQWFYKTVCTDSIFESICQFSIESTMGESLNVTMLPLLLAHTPAGSSIRQVAHYGQCIRFKAFRRYNFNAITNLSVYGKLSPPEYDLSNVKVPSYIHYGKNDQEVNYKDIYTLAGKLPNIVGLLQVERETFNHYDFIWGNDAKVLLYPKVLVSMKHAESSF